MTKQSKKPERTEVPRQGGTHEVKPKPKPEPSQAPAPAREQEERPDAD